MVSAVVNTVAESLLSVTQIVRPGRKKSSSSCSFCVGGLIDPFGKRQVGVIICAKAVWYLYASSILGDIPASGDHLACQLLIV